VKLATLGWVAAYLSMGQLAFNAWDQSGRTRIAAEQVALHHQIQAATDRLVSAVDGLGHDPLSPESALGNLRNLVRGNPEQLRRLRAIAPLLRSKSAELQHDLNALIAEEDNTLDEEIAVYEASRWSGARTLVWDFFGTLAVCIVLTILAARAAASRQQAEYEAQQQKQWFQTLFQFLPEAAVVTDGQQRIVQANLSSQMLLGRQQDLLQRTIREFLPATTVGSSRRSKVRREDGTTFEAEVASAALPVRDGQEFQIHLVRDIDERIGIESELATRADALRRQKMAALNVADDAMRAQQKLRKLTVELERSNEDLSQFASVASHDLQEPLRAISGCLELLEARYSKQLDARAGELIEHSVQGAKRMRQLILDLLDYSRISSNSETLGSADCNQAVQSALTSLCFAIQESKMKVEVGALPWVLADSRQLTQVFQNLIGNSIKYRRAMDPLVKVSAKYEKGEWRITVEDNGLGIEPAYYKRIFGIFQRLHTRSEYPGTGIGLALCKKIVERHGGKIWVESEVGTGSRFYFTLKEGIPHDRPAV
jgi:light-regulated signal transduction histidine kinase (bacteriophytochrome)